MSNKVFDRTIDALARSLDLRSQRQVLISSNIANADTPGYQAQQIDFEDALSRSLDMDHKFNHPTNPAQERLNGKISDVEGEIYNQINDVVREDGNTVDRESEMISLAENQILYNAAADLVKKKLALLKYAISDGGNH